MASNYKRFFKHKSYTMAEIMCQVDQLKKKYSNVKYLIRKRWITISFTLQPTENSILYKLEIRCCVGRTIIDIFVVEPAIKRIMDGEVVPHLYPNSSLCLFYPSYYEWDYKQWWAETLIPWASLWLYYYELWQQTGEWLGGGIHGSNKKDVG